MTEPTKAAAPAPGCSSGSCGRRDLTAAERLRASIQHMLARRGVLRPATATKEKADE